jgi:hypothetical protein
MRAAMRSACSSAGVGPALAGMSKAVPCGRRVHRAQSGRDGDALVEAQELGRDLPRSWYIMTTP